MYYNVFSHSAVDGYMGLFTFYRRLLLLLINGVWKGKNINFIDATLNE